MTTTVLYPGSFDPVTNGHMDILRQAVAFTDKVVIAIGVHPKKKSLFSFEERRQLLFTAIAQSSFSNASDQIQIVDFDGLSIDAARNHGATAMVRGLRDGTDLDYEMQLSGMNGAMAPDIGTIFFPASAPVRPITATLVRQIASMGGDVSGFVPKNVASALQNKFED
ncbi:MAG: pantetheine-phosphate adenylyltransferase [Hyphomicrobiales bacterium]|nr:MAG: pantetheine-phosphate adenylyltransferase [Hyphomicrobiales bacterium]